MFKLMYSILLTLPFYILGCAEEDTPEPSVVEMSEMTEVTEEEPIVPESYIENEGYMLAGSHANILRAYTIAVPNEEGFVPGFDLDGEDTAEGDERSCRQGDFVDP